MTGRLVEIEAILLHRTDRGVRVALTEFGAGAWLPLSLVEIEGPAPGSGAVRLTLPEWLALREGLI